MFVKRRKDLTLDSKDRGADWSVCSSQVLGRKLTTWLTACEAHAGLAGDDVSDCISRVKKQGQPLKDMLMFSYKYTWLDKLTVYFSMYISLEHVTCPLVDATSHSFFGLRRSPVGSQLALPLCEEFRLPCHSPAD